ncbi:MAG: Nif3-like dinuclear metal center hexameric protein [Chthonomonadales bacterium]|nr:Nif3-like dinuclear metal center hexameric protein [Chthonomonadales bacterium]
MDLHELTRYLDEYLRVDVTPDYPPAFNGLQIEAEGPVRRAAFAVDACRFTIEAAIELNADLLVVHHGLFWSGAAPVTGPLYRRLAGLIKNNIALYSAHLPLDVHEEVGNNRVLCRLLGLKVVGSWAPYQGIDIGLIAEGEGSPTGLKASLDAALDTSTRIIAGGGDIARRIAVLTGSGAAEAGLAASLGCDTLITGEGPHHSYFLAEESNLNVLLAGHYATETLGVRALADHLEARLGLETVFIDHPTGL